MTFCLAAPSSAVTRVVYGLETFVIRDASFELLRHTIPSLTAIFHARPPLPLASQCLGRSLHTTSPVLRYGRKSSTVSARTGPDPFDFSELQAGIQKAIDKLKNELSKLRPGGRFNPELLENLAVSPDKKSKYTIRLKELAQVVPRGGRTVIIYVGEKDHVKPIISAILNSSLNLNPQPNPEEPLQLNVPIPPPTKESRLAGLDSAQKTGKVVKMMVRDARGVQQKRFKAMVIARTVRPDDRFKAEQQMEKVVEKGQKEVEELVKGAKRALEAS